MRPRSCWGGGVRKRMENESLGEGNRRKTEEEIDLYYLRATLECVHVVYA